MTTKEEKVVCRQCQHYYITWDAAFPYGCRAFELKSKHLPSQEVLHISGKQCIKFTLKSGVKHG
ncbi:MAG: uracil-DNA glycosylase [Zetaproteobacteria bacterium]|nr:MAG: uracil-DNA glycosylase [Zetaproteobacteria bacterium]